MQRDAGMRLLLLGGTQEARQVAHELHDLPVTVSLSDDARESPSCGTRIGGFGGDEGFRVFLLREGIAAVLDATHPFAERISLRSARICAETGVPYVQLLRPQWRPGQGDRWHPAEDEAGAGGLPPTGARVLIVTGRQRLERFGPMERRCVFVRRNGPAPAGPPPFADGAWQVGVPPYALGDEERLFRALALDWLIVRNAGGEASRAKLDAARGLGMEVAMIRRPARPDAPRVETEAALEWVRQLAKRS
ncbi:precorrin-6A/cobalt-precorrin-6A reductase [Palleronia sp.]|uniref:precorrin-6A/cobalt-precorrin-6A reductase n=1 Tax=Palleronia sp. TaxID=1940284 RepID=UPI0035C8619A